jgi:lipopolysaccharide/colanic/teichoic acid biosynthesis glycosyltransferase
MTETHLTSPSFLRRIFPVCPLTSLDALIKRLIDILASTFGLLLLAPLFIFLAYRIKKDSPGPVFYRGPRLGQGGQTFHILKFRTMYEDPASYQGPRLTAEGDTRITPLGKWLRDTKLNELPQLWNVLLGDMSLVGPRPEDPAIAAGWTPLQRSEITSARPGVTSPASVLYRREESLLKGRDLMGAYLNDVLPTKLRLDQLYVRRRSLMLDLDVLFWTFIVLLPKIGKYEPPEELLFIGPLNRLARRYLNWFSIDFLVSLAAVTACVLVFRLFAPLNMGFLNALALSFGFAFLTSLGGLVFGANRIEWSKAAPEEALNLLPPVLFATCIVLVGMLVFRPLTLFPVRVAALAPILVYGGFIIVRYRARLLSGFASRWLKVRGGGAVAVRERVLVVGSGDTGRFLAWLLRNSAEAQRFKLVGFVDDDLFKLGSRIQGVDVLGRRADIPRLVEKHDAGIIVFAIHNITTEERLELIAICESTPARVVVLPDIMGALKFSTEKPTRPNRKPVPTDPSSNPGADFGPRLQSASVKCQYHTGEKDLDCTTCPENLARLVLLKKEDYWIKEIGD